MEKLNKLGTLNEMLQNSLKKIDKNRVKVINAKKKVDRVLNFSDFQNYKMPSKSKDIVEKSWNKTMTIRMNEFCEND